MGSTQNDENKIQSTENDINDFIDLLKKYVAGKNFYEANHNTCSLKDNKK